jgi:L-ascorbate metabolism protein UlaG (beta-lactamase superfamily)
MGPLTNTKKAKPWSETLSRGYLSAVLLLLLGWGAPASATEGQIRVQWLGQSAFKITTLSGRVIMIDPFITGNPKTPEQFKDLGALGKIDLVLVTHGHGDHVADGPTLARMHDAPLYAPPGLNDTLVALGELPKHLSPRFNKGGVITPLGPDIKITMTRAEHSSEYKWKDPGSGQLQLHVGGEPAGFIIEFENGFKLYHMGDTGLFGDMGLIGEYYKPDLVLMPIGGHFVMDPRDAAYATKRYLKPRFVIPMHYGTIPVLKGTPAEFIHALGDTHTKVFPINPGEERRF